jgi:hypothetical protein
MTGILTINRSMTAKHLLSAAYIDCAALGLCFLMPWTPEFTGYQLPVGLMGYANVSAFASGEGDRVIDMAVAVPAMLIYLFPVFLVVTAALATAIATSGSHGRVMERLFALSAIVCGLFPLACLVVVVLFFSDKGYHGSLGLYFAVFVGLAMIWQLTGIGGKAGGEPRSP